MMVFEVSGTFIFGMITTRRYSILEVFWTFTRACHSHMAKWMARDQNRWLFGGMRFCHTRVLSQLRGLCWVLAPSNVEATLGTSENIGKTAKN